MMRLSLILLGMMAAVWLIAWPPGAAQKQIDAINFAQREWMDAALAYCDHKGDASSQQTARGYLYMARAARYNTLLIEATHNPSLIERVTQHYGAAPPPDMVCEDIAQARGAR